MSFVKEEEKQKERKKTNLSPGQQRGKLAQSDGQVVENVAHAIVTGDHGAPAEPLDGLVDEGSVDGPIKGVAERSYNRPPDE